MNWKALAACTLAGMALVTAGCGGGSDKKTESERQEAGDVCIFP